jgi:hypothetical protein
MVGVNGYGVGTSWWGVPVGFDSDGFSKASGNLSDSDGFSKASGNLSDSDGFSKASGNLSDSNNILR